MQALRRSFLGVAVLSCACGLQLLAPEFASAKDGPRSAATAGQLAIITNWGSDTCSLIDVDGGKELATIDVGLKPYDVKVDPKGRFAYVTCSGSNHISTVDIQAMLEAKDQRIVVGESPRDIDITPTGDRAVVACSGSDSIAVVDLQQKKRLYTVDVGSIPYGIALSDDAKFVLVTLW